jgi:hypothetical protein
VTSALSFNEAKEFLHSNPDAYGWNASFKQWKPVSCISEFVGIIPMKIAQPLISKAFSDKFQVKKQYVESTLMVLEDNIKQSLKSLMRFEQQIQDYKKLTYNLNDNVKDAIDHIEKKHAALSIKSTQLNDIIAITKKEISQIVEGFNHKMQANSIVMPTCVQTSTVHYLNTTNADDILADKAKLAQEKLSRPARRANSSNLALTDTPKATTQLIKDEKNTESTQTITKVYRGVEYKVQK